MSSILQGEGKSCLNHALFCRFSFSKVLWTIANLNISKIYQTYCFFYIKIDYNKILNYMLKIMIPDLHIYQKLTLKHKV